MQPTQTVNLSFTLEELNFIMQVIGELPTKSGAYPLVVKIKDQAESQLKPQEQPKE